MTSRLAFILPTAVVTTAALLLCLAPAEAAPASAAPLKAAPAATPAASASGPAAAPAAPAIEPAAMETLKKMSELLKGAVSFTFTAKTIREQRIESGQMLDFFTTSRIVVTRPDHIRVDAKGSLHNASLWYDGKTVTIYANKAHYYAQADAPPSIDEAVAMLVERFNTPIPVAGFLLKDPYARMMDGVKGAFEVAPAEIDGVACRHLAFSEEAADWQVWIQDGPKPFPRLIVVVYKKLDGAPRVISALSDWNLAPKIAPDEFTFKAPEGAKKVDWATGLK